MGRGLLIPALFLAFWPPSVGERSIQQKLQATAENYTVVHGVLDKIALSSNYPIWIVAFAPGDALTPTGFRRTVSPTNARVVPGGDQPGWETLRWGEKPY